MRADVEFMLMITEKLREISSDSIDSADLRDRIDEFAGMLEEAALDLNEGKEQSTALSQTQSSE